MRIRGDQQAMMARGLVGDVLARSLQPISARAWHDPEHGTVWVEDHRGARSAFRLDTQGRISEVQSPLGRRTRFVFENDQLAFNELPNGLAIRSHYDARGLVRKVERNDGASIEYAFDDQRRLTALGLPDGSRLAMRYGLRGELLELTDRSGGVMRRVYGEDGELLEIVDALGRRTRLGYTDRVVPTQVLHPDGRDERFEPTDAGFLHFLNGEQRGNFVFDDAGDLAEASFSDGGALIYERDDAGRLVRATSADAEVCFEYDEAGRLGREVQRAGEVGYEYDADGRLVALRLPGEERVRYAYDADGRLRTVHDWHGQPQSFEYGGGEKYTSRALPNGVTEYVERTLSSAVMEVRLESTRGGLWTQRYERDAMDRVCRVLDSRHGARSYGYDAAGRLIAATLDRPSADGGAPIQPERFSYDPTGARIAEGDALVVVDEVGRPRRSLHARYEYDDRGNRASAAVGAAGTWHYEFNAHNLLTVALAPDGTRVEYAYDAMCRRIRKVQGTRVTEYLWAGHQLVREVTCEEGAEPSSRDYLYYPGTHLPLSMRVAGHVYQYHCDQLGTPQVLTDALGDVAWSARYSAFGRVDLDAGAKVDNPLRFAGQYHDRETGLHSNRMRYYDPDEGCYLSWDPVAEPGSTERYRYAAADPINLTDPLGLWGEDWPGWAKTTVSIVGGIAAGAAVVAAAVVLAPVFAATALGTALVIGASGIAAGAVGFGLDAAMTKGGCVLCAMGKGALVGLVGALPFIAFPAAAGVLALGGLGALSGAMSYTAEWAMGDEPWNWGTFLWSVGIGAVTAGVAAWLVPKIGARIKARRAAKGKGAQEPASPGKKGTGEEHAPPEEAGKVKKSKVKTGLGDDVDGLTEQSPTLSDDLQSLQDDGWTTKYSDKEGSGSYADRQKQEIVLDKALKDDPKAATQVLAHEVGHAKHALEPYSPPKTGDTKTSYVDRNRDRHLRDEGAATLKNAKARSEVLDSGGDDIGIAGKNAKEYEKIAQDVDSGKITEAEGRQRVADAFGDETTSTTGETYNDYYGRPYEEYWDQLYGGGAVP
jgi:RHS repeat-associated protein